MTKCPIGCAKTCPECLALYREHMRIVADIFEDRLSGGERLRRPGSLDATVASAEPASREVSTSF